jgi:hypothetical protein
MSRRICLFLLTWSTGWAAFAADPYPPQGFQRTQVVQPSDISFRLEEWKSNDNKGSFGQFLFQTWLIPKSGSGVRLSDIPRDGFSADTFGFESTYSFSPTSRYIFREQKVWHCRSGAYIYERDTGLAYHVLVPDLDKRAVEFFQRDTGLKFEADCGIVEFVNWVSPDAVAISLRGYSTGPLGMLAVSGSIGRELSIFNWRCVFSIPSQSFSIPGEWVGTDKAAIAKP